MDLDVIMPFHRADEFLHLAIDSLAASVKVKIRLIAIDDRVDQTLDISKYFSKFNNIELVKTNSGVGYGRALELGSKFLNSDMCALMNSDDLVHPEKFYRQLKSLEQNDLSLTKMQRIDRRNNFVPALTGKITSSTYHPIFLLFGSYGADATWCMRTEWWAKNSFFDGNDCLDWRIGLNAFPTTKIGLIDDELYFYRRHNAQVTSNKNISSEKMNPVFDLWEKLAKYYLLNNNVRSIFDLVATPWRPGISANYRDVAQWFQGLDKFENEIGKDVLQNIKSIMKRRFLFAARSSQNSNIDRMRYGFSGLLELPNLLLDLSSIIQS